MKAHRRHLVIDNIQRIIFIEVQTDLKGHIKQQEFNDIKNGQWHKYVPVEMKTILAKEIGHGYQVQPFHCIGHFNEEYYVVQVTELRKSHVILPTA